MKGEGSNDGSGGLGAIIALGVGVGLLAVALVFAVVYGGGGTLRGLESGGLWELWVRYAPAINAGLNGLTALLLILGRRRIRAGDEVGHRRRMQAALGVSALFLISYLGYHALAGDTHYPLQVAGRSAYLIFLVSHILASALCLPLILITVMLILTGRRAAHRRLARLTWPLWMYVSVTGIGVFIWLRSALA